jgi:hypothetical protein
MCTKFSFKSLQGKDHMEDMGVNDRIILKWILKNQGGGCGLYSLPQNSSRLL